MRDPRFKVVKFFERSGNKAAAKFPQITTVRTFADLLADDADLVIITTPNLTHYAFSPNRQLWQGNTSLLKNR